MKTQKINAKPFIKWAGGKGQLLSQLDEYLPQILSEWEFTYIEPFAGGAGVALSLLIEGAVDQIVINDYDKAIYSFWRALKEAPQELIDLIENLDLTDY